MEVKDANTHQLGRPPAEKEKNIDGYPLYPLGEDIYNQSKLEEDIDPEAPDTLKKPIGVHLEGPNETDFEDDVSGDDLDVPGSELDDEDEAIGSEDEENNYYSLGGDDHNNLEEDNGD